MTEPPPTPSIHWDGQNFAEPPPDWLCDFLTRGLSLDPREVAAIRYPSAGWFVRLADGTVTMTDRPPAH